MREVVFIDETRALRALTAAGAADDEKHLAIGEDDLIQRFFDVGEDGVGVAFGVDLVQFLLLVVVGGDGGGGLVEGDEATLDGLLVVVDATGSLAAFEETLGHLLVGDFEVKHAAAGRDVLLERDALFDLTRITVDEIPVGGCGFGDHGVFQQFQHHLHRD